MVIKVGINGFGRIGRIVARACLQNPGLQLSAINDPAITVEYVSYLMKFDSTHGKLNGIISHNDEEIVINGVSIRVFHEKYPSDIPWQSAGVQYVVESSGMFTNYERASGHLVSVGVKRVIVTAPSVDVPMVIMGVNDLSIPPDRRVISCASSTLYCLAPIIKVLEDSFGVEEGFITSIHAMTPSLKPLDGLCLRGKHWRDHRSIHQNIIPAPTGACKALGKILPISKDKLSGMAFRVPIVNVSVLDLTVRLQANTTLQEIANNVQQASKSTLRNIIKSSNEDAVSSDFAGETHSCIFDETTSIQLKPNFFKIICWYENENSYACRIVDSIIFSENQYFLEIPKSIKNLRTVTSSKMLQADIPRMCNCRNGVANVPDAAMEVRPVISSNKTPISSVSHKLPTPTISAVNTSKDEWIKSNEISKIWNNRREILQPCLVKQMKCPLYQTCTGLPPSMKKIECNNQERLENVRREFNKMVNITEDLLRKTQSTQGVRSISRDEIKVSRQSLVTKEKDVKCYTINSKIKSVEELVDTKCSGDMIQIQNVKRVETDTVFLASKVNQKSEFSGGINSMVKDSKNLIDISEAIKKLKENDDDDKTAQVTQNKKDASNETSVKLDRGECKQISETTIASNDGRPKTEEFKFVWNSHHIKKNKEIGKEQTDVTSENVEKLSISKCKHLSNGEINEDFPETNDLKQREDEISLNKCMLMAKKSNINLFDEALRKRNIVLVNQLCVNLNGEGPSSDDINDTPADTDDKVDDKIVLLTEPTIEQLSLKNVLEDSKCTTPENTVTTISNDNRGANQDIYDKLDSTSGTDSNNSFEIKERTSQVIQLTDLTNSLEDLTRLNNICRIIEISDELSDKLFSALDETSPDMNKKKWSFKDLCARIKLDEFCNKVFGGPAVNHD